MSKKTISVDFDGVLHHYKSWEGAAIIDGPVVPGAIEWLVRIIEDGRFAVQVFSSRSGEPGGRVAMSHWLEARLVEFVTEHRTGDQNEAFELADLVGWPINKPPAHVSVDDRGWRYEGGAFPEPDALHDFKPWWKP